MIFLRNLLVTAFILLASIMAKADEGMWLPQLLAKLNEKQMKSMGMKISAADIYNINKGSLKDAIVSFAVPVLLVIPMPATDSVIGAPSSRWRKLRERLRGRAGSGVAAWG